MSNIDTFNVQNNDDDDQEAQTSRTSMGSTPSPSEDKKMSIREAHKESHVDETKEGHNSFDETKVANLPRWFKEYIFISILIGEFLYTTGISMIIVFMPPQLSSIGFTDAMVGFVVMMNGVGNISSSFCLRFLLKYLHRRALFGISIILVGICIGMIGIIVEMEFFKNHIYLLMPLLQFGGFVLGFCRVGLVTVGLSTLGQYFPDSMSQRSSWFAVALMMGWVIGLLSASFIYLWLGYRAPFIICALLLWVLMIYPYRFIPNYVKKKVEQGDLSAEMLNDRKELSYYDIMFFFRNIYVILILCVVNGIGSFESTGISLFLTQSFGIKDNEVAYYLSVSVGCALVFIVVANIIAKKANFLWVFVIAGIFCPGLGSQLFYIPKTPYIVAIAHGSILCNSLTSTMGYSVLEHQCKLQYDLDSVTLQTKDRLSNVLTTCVSIPWTLGPFVYAITSYFLEYNHSVPLYGSMNIIIGFGFLFVSGLIPGPWSPKHHISSSPK